MLTADTNDQDAVDAAIKQTQVVVACAGPFAKIGEVSQPLTPVPVANVAQQLIARPICCRALPASQLPILECVRTCCQYSYGNALQTRSILCIYITAVRCPEKDA